MKVFNYVIISGILALAFVNSAQASSIMSVSFEKSLPFGPFTPDETIQIIGTVTNTSPDQAISICEGVCIGDLYTYSLGAWMSLPNDYMFNFGNGEDTTLGFLNGQIAGELLPGEKKDFIYGELSPISQALLGTHDFIARLQIFTATAERPMIDSSTFGGTFQVVNAISPIPEPATIVLLASGLIGLGLSRRKVSSVISTKSV